MKDNSFMFPQYIFVYGTLMKGFGNNRLLSQAKYLGPAQTLHSSYKMYDIGCPIVTLATTDGSKVEGELYLVPPHHIHAIDRLEDHPLWYKRTRIPLEDGTLAWCYLQKEDERADYWLEIEPKKGIVKFEDYVVPKL